MYDHPFTPAFVLFGMVLASLLASLELLWLKRSLRFTGSWWSLALLASVNLIFILLLFPSENSYVFLLIFPLPIIPLAYVLIKPAAYSAVARIAGSPVYSPWKLAFLTLFVHAAVVVTGYQGFAHINPTQSNLEQAIRDQKNGLLDLMLWISLKSEPNLTILVNEALTYDNDDAVRRLIRRGADPRSDYWLSKASRETQWRMTKWMLDRGLTPQDFEALSQSPPFIDIAVGHGLAELEYCLQKGFDPKKYPGVIAAALQTGDVQVLKDKTQLLLNHGANINGKDVTGFEPVYTLLLRDADLSPVLTFLIEKGADINVRSPHPLYPPNSETLSAGLTPLMLAVIDKDPQYVAILVKSGADKTIRDSRGFDALDYARKLKADDTTIRLLK